MDIRDIFKTEPSPVQEKQTKPEIDVWSFVWDLIGYKKYLFSEETEKKYLPWMINHALYGYQDILYDVQEMNRRPGLDKKLQHDYLFYSIRKMYRKDKPKWLKKEKDEEILMLMYYYGYNKNRAEEVYSLHTKEDIDHINYSMRKGGPHATRKKKIT